MLSLLALALISGRVTAITDGDTFRIGATRVRLAHIDANEMHGGCHTVCAPRSARAARDNLARLALGKHVVCRQTGTSYRRIVAECSVDGVDIGCAQLRGGFAIDWARYDRHGRYTRRCGL